MLSLRGLLPAFLLSLPAFLLSLPAFLLSLPGLLAEVRGHVPARPAGLAGGPGQLLA